VTTAEFLPMQLEFSVQPPPEIDALIELLPKENRTRTAISVAAAEFSGAPNSTLFLHQAGTLYVGLGDGGKIDGATIRAACGTAAKLLQGKGRTRIALQLAGWTQFAREAAEGVLLGSYRFADFKASPADGPLPAGLETVTLLASAEELPAMATAARRGVALAAATNYARQIANQPGNLFFPETLAEAARQLAAGSDGALSVTVLAEDALRDGGFGGLMAVGGGSIHGPRLIVLHYQGGAPDEAPLALVGKSITFDSGGISIKPAERMEEMIWDKCGGCAVIGAMHGIAALKPKCNIIGILSSAENLTGPGAFRPGDILTVYDGKKIEINNTDAEGRVVLADAIGYARREFKPAAIVDLATLTGACVVALGDWAAGLWNTDEGLRDRLLKASAAAGERLWPMPLYEEYSEQIKSDVALIKNSSGRWGGACTAAAFVRTFAEDTPWAHLDIAGTSWITKDRPDLARGATGFGVRILLELVGAW
jgi:leucyl aminopeptidase